MYQLGSPYSHQCFCVHKLLLLTFLLYINPLSANPTKWSNILKQFVGKSRWQKPTNCLSVFGHFVGLALKGLTLTNCA